MKADHEFYFVKRNGKITFPDVFGHAGEQLRIRQEYLDQLPEGAQGYERLGYYKKPKTDAQLKAFFGLMISTCMEEFKNRKEDTSAILFEMLKYILEKRPSGNEITKDWFKALLYLLCPIYEDGQQKTLSTASKDATCKFYDDCCNIIAAIWGIVIPDCDKDWRKKKIESVTDMKFKE